MIRTPSWPVAILKPDNHSDRLLTLSRFSLCLRYFSSSDMMSNATSSSSSLDSESLSLSISSPVGTAFTAMLLFFSPSTDTAGGVFSARFSGELGKELEDFSSVATSSVAEAVLSDDLSLSVTVTFCLVSLVDLVELLLGVPCFGGCGSRNI